MQQVGKKICMSIEAADNLLETLSAAGEHKKACALAPAMCNGRRVLLCRSRVSGLFRREPRAEGASNQAEPTNKRLVPENMTLLYSCEKVQAVF